MLDLKKLRASRKGRNKISINLETNADVLEGEGREVIEICWSVIVVSESHTPNPLQVFGAQIFEPIDEHFLIALPHLPETGGIAVGMDRLAMFFAGVDTIDAITVFPPEI